MEDGGRFDQHHRYLQKFRGTTRRLVSRIKNADEFAETTTKITSLHSGTLCVFAERMASLSVRDRSPEDIRIGLLAAALAEHIDNRDVLVVLAPLLRAAELLGRDPVEDFTDVADIMQGEAGKLLRDFANRVPEKRTLEVMGYIEDSDEDGFRFRRTW